MTWNELKKLFKSKGVRDDTKIEYIDLSFDILSGDAKIVIDDAENSFYAYN
jgi:hypothetical protein